MITQPRFAVGEITIVGNKLYTICAACCTLMRTQMHYDHSYLSVLAHCRRQHYYQNELHLRSKVEAPYLVAGSAMHKGMAVLYGGAWDVEGAVSVLKEHYTISPGGEYSYLTSGHLELVLRQYAGHWRAKETMQDVMLIEKPLLGKVIAFPIGGMPDMLATEYGEAYVVDHKFTTSYIGAHQYTRAKMSHQGRIYCLLAQQNGFPNVMRCIFNVVYMGKQALNPASKADKWDRFAFQYWPEDLRETEEWVDELLAELAWRKDSRHSHKAFWPQNPGAHCVRCPYQPLCGTQSSLRPGIIAQNFVIQEPTGLLASGADNVE